MHRILPWSVAKIAFKSYCKVMVLRSQGASEPQIRFKGKAQADRESAVRHTFWPMSIYRRPAIRRRRIETASMQISEGYMPVSKIQSSPKNIRQATGHRQPTMNSALLQTG
jgi:hypothetical protein